MQGRCIAGALALAVLSSYGALFPAAAQRAKGVVTSPRNLPLSPPLPPPRPRDLDRPQTSDAPQAAAEGEAQEDVRPSACLALLKQRGVDFTQAPQRADAGACAIEEPITIKSVRLESGELVTLNGGVTMRCALAAQIADWVRADLAPIAVRHGLQLRALSGIGAHECRNRNHQTGGPISEHASGNAFDVRRFEFKDAKGIELMVDRAEETRTLRNEVRASACGRFTTVLGSGSDRFHEDHLHVDLRERRGGYRLCQWDVR